MKHVRFARNRGRVAPADVAVAIERSPRAPVMAGFAVTQFVGEAKAAVPFASDMLGFARDDHPRGIGPA